MEIKDAPRPLKDVDHDQAISDSTDGDFDVVGGATAQEVGWNYLHSLKATKARK